MVVHFQSARFRGAGQHFCIPPGRPLNSPRREAVVWQAAVNPVVALELLATGVWSGAGVLGPEAFDAVPFLDRLVDYGSPWHVRAQ